MEISGIFLPRQAADTPNVKTFSGRLEVGDIAVTPHPVDHSAFGAHGSTLIYSMWSGYLTEKFKGYCRMKGIEIKRIHTSGHATMRDLKRFTSAITPRVVIPIHTC